MQVPSLGLLHNAHSARQKERLLFYVQHYCFTNGAGVFVQA
jgi:hypothetical protein